MVNLDPEEDNNGLKYAGKKEEMPRVEADRSMWGSVIHRSDKCCAVFSVL